MFKKIINYILLLILLSLVILWVWEANSSRLPKVLENLVKAGKLDNRSINLKLNYLTFIPVGSAKIENLGKEKFRNTELIHVYAEAKTLDYIASLFSAKARIDSYIAPEQLHSVYFLQHIEMTNKPNDDREIFYDQKKHIMKYKGPRGNEERVIDDHARDPICAIFYIQNKTFNLGEEIKLSMNTNQKNYILTGRFIDKEIIRLANKDYEIWLIQAEVRRKDKSPRHQVSFKIWFLDTGNTKIPLLIKAMTNAGPILARAQ